MSRCTSDTVVKTDAGCWLLEGALSDGFPGQNDGLARYLAKMLRLAQPNPGDVFVDMGSGTGKACVATGLLYPELAACRGVELLQGLHREAQVRHQEQPTPDLPRSADGP